MQSGSMYMNQNFIEEVDFKNVDKIRIIDWLMLP